jgi:glucan biosynthesis protein C
MASSRLYGLDVLRGVAMILGIFLHATIAYKSGYHYGEWAFDKDFTSYFFDWLFLWINSFRMQLFFLLAGFFSHLLINKIGLIPFVENRIKRIGIPLLICYFTILPLTLLPYLYIQYSKMGEPWIQLRSFFQDFFLLKSHSGFMHLWFLQHLMIFYFVIFCFYFLRNRFNLSTSRLKITTASPVKFFFLSSCGIAVLSQLFPAPLPSIWTGFVTPIAQLLYYFSFFMLGVMLEENRSLFLAFKTYYKPFLLIGSVISVFIVIAVDSYSSLPLFSLEHMLLKVFFAFQTMLLVLGFIGMFLDIFKEESILWRYVSEAAYWVYLIHLPIVLTAQLLLIDSGVPGVLKFPLVVIVSLLLSFTSYHYLVRSTWVGLILNGKKIPSKKTSIQST